MKKAKSPKQVYKEIRIELGKKKPKFKVIKKKTKKAYKKYKPKIKKKAKQIPKNIRTYYRLESEQLNKPRITF